MGGLLVVWEYLVLCSNSFYVNKFILDTSVYGVLVDEKESDYTLVRKIIEYASKNRQYFLTTFIIARELGSMDVDERIRAITLPAYYITLPPNKAPLEVLHSSQHELARKLAWSYIQKLEKTEAYEVMPDALNYAWSSIGEVDVLVTRNRRGILAEEYHKILKRSNRRMNLGFVEITSPQQFYETYVPRT